MLTFKNKILFVGYGAVAQCALPILVKHINVPAKRITVMDFEDRKAALAPWIKRGVKFGDSPRACSRPDARNRSRGQRRRRRWV